MERNRKLILYDGTEFPGYGFGGTKDAVCEVVFNTSMTGYQEILSDPSYTDQAVVMSYPLIGNYGITNEDYESRVIAPSALIIRDLNEALSSRFAILQMPSISEIDLERLLASRFPGMKGKIRSQFVRLFIEIDKKAESAEISERALDLRGLLDAIALTEKGIKAGDTLEMCVVNKTFDKYERAMIRDVISARIPADLGRNEIFG